MSTLHVVIAKLKLGYRFGPLCIASHILFWEAREFFRLRGSKNILGSYLRYYACRKMIVVTMVLDSVVRQ